MRTRLKLTPFISFLCLILTVNKSNSSEIGIEAFPETEIERASVNEFAFFTNLKEAGGEKVGKLVEVHFEEIHASTPKNVEAVHQINIYIYPPKENSDNSVVKARNRELDDGSGAEVDVVESGNQNANQNTTDTKAGKKGSKRTLKKVLLVVGITLLILFLIALLYGIYRLVEYCLNKRMTKPKTTNLEAGQPIDDGETRKTNSDTNSVQTKTSITPKSVGIFDEKDPFKSPQTPDSTLISKPRSESSSEMPASPSNTPRFLPKN